MNKMNQPVCTIVGTSNRMGWNIARHYASRGYRVAFIGWSRRDLDQYQERAENAGFKADTFFLEDNKNGTLEKNLRKVRKELGHIDVMVYNETIWSPNFREYTQENSIWGDLRVNENWALTAVNEVFYFMKDYRRGRIFFTASEFNPRFFSRDRRFRSTQESFKRMAHDLQRNGIWVQFYGFPMDESKFGYGQNRYTNYSFDGQYSWDYRPFNQGYGQFYNQRPYGYSNWNNWNGNNSWNGYNNYNQGWNNQNWAGQEQYGYQQPEMGYFNDFSRNDWQYRFDGYNQPYGAPYQQFDGWNGGQWNQGFQQGRYNQYQPQYFGYGMNGPRQWSYGPQQQWGTQYGQGQQGQFNTWNDDFGGYEQAFEGQFDNGDDFAFNFDGQDNGFATDNQRGGNQYV